MFLNACSAELNSEGQRCAFPDDDDPRRQEEDSATFGDFVTDEVIINAQTQRRMQTEEEEVECHWNMETLDIAQEEQEHHRVVSPSTVMGQGEAQSNEAADKKGEKKRGRKKKAATTNEEEEEEEEANKSPEKKFKRRKKNTTLEKELLETPDDDIKHLPIRDMLRLVSYRESLEKKEAKGASVVPPTQESNTNASWDNQYYSQEGFDSEGEFGMEEGENHVQVKPDSPVNYQTYMKKTHRSRWSKQETQVFYEGIQAFGINLPMVQQLLPERRTLHQIKLKYKLEDRKNPLKLNHALSTPCKDLTLYHTVNKKLQQEAAAAKEGEEAETTSDVPENEEEQTKSDELAGDGDGDGDGVKESDGGDQFDENEGDDDDDDDFGILIKVRCNNNNKK